MFFSGKVALNWETAWPAVTYPLTALPKAVFWAAPFRTSKGNFQTHGTTNACSISQRGRQKCHSSNSPFASAQGQDITTKITSKGSKGLKLWRPTSETVGCAMQTRARSCKDLESTKEFKWSNNVPLDDFIFWLPAKPPTKDISHGRNGSSEAAPYSMPMQAPLMMSPAMALMMWTPSNLSVFLQLKTSEFTSLRDGVSQLYAPHTMPSRIHRCPCWQWIDRWQQRRTSLFGTPHLEDDNVGSVSCISGAARAFLL